MGQGRIIGVDYGAKRVGLALSDPLRLFSQPLGAFEPTAALQKLEELDATDGVECLVVGWPVLPDGSEGEAVKKVRSYIKRLRGLLPDVAIVTWNEEYTSELAKSLISRGERPSLWRTGRGRIDAAAAAILLQEYLDGLKNEI